MKICVYAISKNEEQFVERFYKSCKGADLVVLCDTGSTDLTELLARNAGMTVYNISVNPWRFDQARNIALGLIPQDIDVCISLDLDEVLMPGWREEIERVWTEQTTRLQYRYDWGRSHIFNATKIHKRHGYAWQNYCHEMIYPDPRSPEVWATTDFLLITHLPDDSKSRGNYLSLLEADVKQNPHSSRNTFYLGREYFFAGQYQKSIDTFIYYLDMPESTWYHERSFALRTMAKCHQSLARLHEAKVVAEIATKEAKNLRENWCLLAEIAQKQEDWRLSFASATRALNIHQRDYAYTSDESVWGSRPYDAAAIAAHYLGLKDSAKKYGQQALDLDPENPRLQSNMSWYSK